jgi:hypothetical protein
MHKRASIMYSFVHIIVIAHVLTIAYGQVIENTCPTTGTVPFIREGSEGKLISLTPNDINLLQTCASFESITMKYVTGFSFSQINFNLYKDTNILKTLSVSQTLYLNTDPKSIPQNLPASMTKIELFCSTDTCTKLIGTNPTFSPNINFLDLCPNSLSGTLDFVQQLTNVETLYLCYNSFTGSIPSFSLHSKLISLRLDQNQLTGTIPSFASNTELTTLWIQNNQLSGSIPSFASNTKLIDLELYNNKLSGSIPSFSQNSKLSWLRLNQNQLTGSIPTDFPDSLVLIRLDQNYLTGTVPSTLPSSLQTFRVDNNQLQCDAYTVDGICSSFQGFSSIRSPAIKYASLKYVNIQGNSFQFPQDTSIFDKCMFPSSIFKTDISKFVYDKGCVGLSETKCKYSTCGIGHYPFDENKIVCASCPAGTYSDSTSPIDESTCKPCLQNTFAKLVGSSRCDPCSSGTMTSSIGASICEIVPSSQTISQELESTNPNINVPNSSPSTLIQTTTTNVNIFKYLSILFAFNGLSLCIAIAAVVKNNMTKNRNSKSKYVI